MKHRPKSGNFLFNGKGNGNVDEFNEIKNLKNSRSNGERQLCAQCVNGIIQDISRTVYNPKYS
jgi:hypothetical protein